eukprot:CAMPEP_0171898392 /NCGR_PEP_ID=MMETSP0992-20121227/48696_1 /TAXON_ID=483369 /ORGANISM="non described non described, Strain CCMP2098" /LENGTH=423 /DNA_ID=CAMNT_0012526687 /DNA_START=74 /DNA_END=1346 /DNA_ORIENTATION=+
MERSQRYSSAAVAKEGGMRKLRFSSAALSGAGSAFLMDTTAISEPNLVPSDGFVHLIGTSQPDSDASIGVELEDKTMLACFLIIVTDVVATLQSVALIVLQNRGYSMLSLLLVSSLVGAFICGVLMITQGLPLVRDPKSRCALAERGLLDAYVLLGQKWKAHDVVLALSCLAGVLLVTDIWNANEGSSENDARTQWMEGMGAALLFALISADAALVVNTRLRGEAPLSMVLATMLCASVLAASAAAATGSSVLPTRHAASSSSPSSGFLLGGRDLDSSSESRNSSVESSDRRVLQSSRGNEGVASDAALVAGLALSLPLMMLTRNKAFTLSGDTSVSMLLYLEIALAFVWQSALLGEALPSGSQVAGASLIVGGSCCSVALKSAWCGSSSSSSSSSDGRNGNGNGSVSKDDTEGLIRSISLGN